MVVGIRPSDFEDADVWRDETRAVLDAVISRSPQKAERAIIVLIALTFRVFRRQDIN